MHLVRDNFASLGFLGSKMLHDVFHQHVLERKRQLHSVWRAPSMVLECILKASMVALRTLASRLVFLLLLAYFASRLVSSVAKLRERRVGISTRFHIGAEYTRPAVTVCFFGGHYPKLRRAESKMGANALPRVEDFVVTADEENSTRKLFSHYAIDLDTEDAADLRPCVTVDPVGPVTVKDLTVCD